MASKRERRRRREAEDEDDLNRGPVTVVRREDKKDGRYEYKLAKIDGKTDRALATAAKRSATASLLKWLVILIGVVFAMFKMGGGGGFSKIIDMVKGFGGG
jgi:hypothetical protein